ncbi:MAG: tRNA uridine-5-carboxymethylaminomethyl(34) synthesis GTPase MnmE [Muribaculaceae bacterium]|nr:tRNA uridine-5-carboxymethylaminomethyl(34) synthesis GTPase MnmE [Muribaculaceae bacterium]
MSNPALIYNNGDTICAISTPSGVGGIAVARVSGPDAFDIVGRIWQGAHLQSVEGYTAHYGTVLQRDGSFLDQALATVFKAPRSFTGENVVEISVHGSKWIQQRLLDSLIGAGARMALPGEFTRRAYASGKVDLAQAEAVADMISSNSGAAHQLAMSQMRGEYSRAIDAMRAELVQLASLLELELDFAEEEVEFASRSRLLELADALSAKLQASADSFSTGRAIKDGIPVALVGATNAGKSSLLNALVGDDRAIVSDIHGTTRDVIEDIVEIGDYLIRFRDTAGMRETDDPIEQMGIERSRRAASDATIVVYVVDGNEQLHEATDITANDLIIALNKCDLSRHENAGAPYLTAQESDTTQHASEQIASARESKLSTEQLQKQYAHARVISCSAVTGEGLDELCRAITAILDQRLAGANITVANARHAEAFAGAAESLRAFAAALRAGIPSDLAAQDLRQAIYHLSTVTGQITTPELLQTIFQSFCIGK